MNFVQAKNYTKATRTSVSLIVIHTAECGETSKAAENVSSWGAGANAPQASWHFMVDNDSIVQSVREEDIAWHAGPVNHYSIGIEHAGYAGQTEQDWADDYSRAVLERSAQLVAGICTRWSIPVTRLSADDLRAGVRSGICGHVDVTNGLTNGKGHTDPGRSFPWDWYLERIAAHMKPDTIPTIESGAVESPLILPAPTELDISKLVIVECEGTTWLVSPIYHAPIGIGAADELAKSLGCELPSPKLVDAIWRAADLKIDANLMVRADHDGTPRTMDSASTHADQCARLQRLVGDRSLGVDFRLLAGAFKDVVRHNGQIGLYGWHRKDGSVIQGFFSGHALAWRDYSQGLRLVRRFT